MKKSTMESLEKFLDNRKEARKDVNWFLKDSFFSGRSLVSFCIYILVSIILISFGIPVWYGLLAIPVVVLLRMAYEYKVFLNQES